MLKARKWEWKNPIPYWFPPQIFLKFLPPPSFFETLTYHLKRSGRGRKLMSFHLKIYVILFNSFCVFFMRSTLMFFLMFLLLPAIKNKTIIQTKTEDRKSVTSSNWERLTNPWKFFKPNKPTRQLSFWEFKILKWFYIIYYTLQDHTIHQLHFLQGFLPNSLYSYSDRCKKFFLRYYFTIIVHISQT